MKARKTIQYYAHVTNRNTTLIEDFKPRMVYMPMARMKKSTFKDKLSTAVWGAINVVGWFGCFYTISEMGGHLPKLFM